MVQPGILRNDERRSGSRFLRPSIGAFALALPDFLPDFRPTYPRCLLVRTGRFIVQAPLSNVFARHTAGCESGAVRCGAELGSNLAHHGPAVLVAQDWCSFLTYKYGEYIRFPRDSCLCLFFIVSKQEQGALNQIAPLRVKMDINTNKTIVLITGGKDHLLNTTAVRLTNAFQETPVSASRW